jgi:hypothetical protein
MREALGTEMVVKPGFDIAERYTRRLWLLVELLQSSERYVWNRRTT